MDETNKRNIMSKITNNLAKEQVAYDINGYQRHLHHLEYGEETQ